MLIVVALPDLVAFDDRETKVAGLRRMIGSKLSFIFLEQSKDILCRTIHFSPSLPLSRRSIGSLVNRDGVPRPSSS